VAYLLQFDERAVVPYLLDLDLSREGRVVLAAAFTHELRGFGDLYINNSERRLAPGSDCFRVDLVFRDPARLVISPTAAHR